MMTGTRDYQDFRLILPEQKRLRCAFDVVTHAAGFVYEKPNIRAPSGQLFDRKGLLQAARSYELRADAALDWLSEGAADLAVVGADMLAEYKAVHPDAPLKPVLTLDRIARCSLWIAARPEIYIRDITDLGDMRLATAYPAFLQQWLQQNNVRPSRIISQKGNVEATIEAGRADAILEVVETGASLAANGLEKKLWAFNSQALLVRNINAFSPAGEKFTTALVARLEKAATSADSEARPNRDPASRTPRPPVGLSARP